MARLLAGRAELGWTGRAGEGTQFRMEAPQKENRPANLAGLLFSKHIQMHCSLIADAGIADAVITLRHERQERRLPIRAGPGEVSQRGPSAGGQAVLVCRSR